LIFSFSFKTLRKILPCINEVLTDLFRLPPYDTQIIGTNEDKTTNIPFYFMSDEDTILFLVSVLRNQLEIAFLVRDDCAGLRKSYFRKFI
jgi:hypothetical protein